MEGLPSDTVVLAPRRALQRTRWSGRIWLLPLLPALACGLGFEECDSSPGKVVLTSWSFTPEVPRTNRTLTVHASGHLSPTAEVAVNASELLVETTVSYCRRHDDCMEVHHERTPGCELFRSASGVCKMLHPGKHVALRHELHLPLGLIRGTYSVRAQVRRQADDAVLGCFELEPFAVFASLSINKFRDYLDAIISFGTAASASYALGSSFPRLSGGMFPQITGFLCIGIVVGPYCANLVTRMDILLIGNFINTVSLAFIGGAAGAEIFLPEFRSILGQMGLQVSLITVFTLVIVTFGMLLVTGNEWLDVPAVNAQPTGFAKAAICLLMAALMTARSPASAIAVIAELNCSHSTVAKMTLGITVLGDIVVLVLFSLCSQVCRIAIRGGTFGPSAFFTAVGEILASVLLGALTAVVLRGVLSLCSTPAAASSEAGSSDGEEPRLPGPGPAPRERRANSRELSVRASQATGQDAGEAHLLKQLEQEKKVERGYMARGVLVLASLWGSFQLAASCAYWTGDRLHMEPLLACTVASCLCGHDQARRTALLDSLGMWTRIVLLPFFTLAGASLQLPGLWRVFPAAITLVAFRIIGSYLGSMSAGLLSRRLYPASLSTTGTVHLTWTCLLAQAGVTLGLVIGVQATRPFHKWSSDFAVLILGVVMLNQILGPVFCRVGMTAILKEEVQYKATCSEESEEESMSMSASLSLSSTTLVSSRRPRELSIDGLYDRLAPPDADAMRLAALRSPRQDE